MEIKNNLKEVNSIELNPPKAEKFIMKLTPNHQNSNCPSNIMDFLFFLENIPSISRVRISTY